MPCVGCRFSISRASDPKLQFSIDPQTGVVKIRRRLDRETVALHELIIQAIDKGQSASQVLVLGHNVPSPAQGHIGTVDKGQSTSHALGFNVPSPAHGHIETIDKGQSASQVLVLSHQPHRVTSVDNCQSASQVLVLGVNVPSTAQGHLVTIGRDM